MRNFGILGGRQRLSGASSTLPSASRATTQRDSIHLACVQREGDLLGPVGPPMEARSLGIRGRKDQAPIDVRELAAAVFVSIIVTLPIALVSAAACVWFAFFE